MTRIAPRKMLQTAVVFEDEFGEDFLYFTSSNISTSGIFVQTRLSFAPGTKVFLKFPLFVGDPPIRVAGEIMRQHTQRRGPGRKKQVTPGVGIKFLGLSQEDFIRIEKLSF